MMVICPYCLKQAELVDSSKIYGKSYGNIWICYDCDAYIGCHKNSNKPLGTLANSELREYRIKAHSAFDPLWRVGNGSRKLMYEWLAGQIGVDVGDCHIAMFDVEQCKKAIEICGRSNE